MEVSFSIQVSSFKKNLQILLVSALCEKGSLVRDSEGKYVKTLCDVNLALNHNDAQAKCQQNGLQLFKVEKPEDLNMILAHGDAVYPAGHLWFDGKKRNQCNIILRSIYFEKTTRPCSIVARFFCEFKGKYYNQIIKFYVAFFF